VSRWGGRYGWDPRCASAREPPPGHLRPGAPRAKRSEPQEVPQPCATAGGDHLFEEVNASGDGQNSSRRNHPSDRWLNRTCEGAAVVTGLPPPL
jgi:hypothetical protein